MERTPRISTRTLSSIVLGTVAALAPATAALAAPAPIAGAEQMTARVERSVVQLEISWTGYLNYRTRTGYRWAPKAIQSTSRCTGFFVSTTGHVTTAGHCVDPAGGRRNIIKAFLNAQVAEGLLTQAQAQSILPEADVSWKVEGDSQGSQALRTVRISQPSGVTGAVLTAPLTAQVIDFKGLEQGDVALLKAEATDTPALPVAGTDPPSGAAVTSVGFPGSVKSVSDPAQLRASFKTGTVSSQQINQYGVPQIEVNADISRGMSGGPTVDAEGNVLGVNSYTIVDEAQNFNFITDTTDLRDWLTGRNVPLVAQGSPEPPTGPGTNAGSGTGAGPAEQPRLEPAAVTSEGTGTPSWMWALLGTFLMVMLAGAGALFVILRTRQTVARRPAGPPATPPGAMTPGATTPAASSPTPSCTVCGAAATPGAAFCAGCGTALGAAPTSTLAPAQAAW